MDFNSYPKPKIMNRPTKTEELIEEIEEFDVWLSPTLKKYLEEVEEYLDYLEKENKEAQEKIFTYFFTNPDLT